jgi:hypothetical protein
LDLSGCIVSPHSSSRNAIDRITASACACERQ